VTPWIHRYLGIGVALMLLPMGLSATAVAILIGNLMADLAYPLLDPRIRYG